MVDKSIKSTTLKNDLCIGCGICKVVCPVDAIKMLYNNNCEFKPDINEDICNNCSICIDYCPNTKGKIDNKGLKVSSSNDSEYFGLENSKHYISYDKNKRDRKRSASGGIVSALAIELLEHDIIDGVIHAQMIKDNIGKPHYKASYSNSVREIDEKRSSFYGPICFSNILDNIKNKSGRYLIIGVPCIISGLKYLFKRHNDFKDKKIYTIALACSHNVNGQFVDFLAESLGIDCNKKFYINLRDKDNISDANNFNNHFFDSEDTIVKINRFDSIFTKTWRNYFFSMNCCHYCSDFWGYEADISTKDAWGDWASDPAGKSMVVVRNKKILKLLKKADNIILNKIDIDTTFNNQSNTVYYKQLYIKYRLKNRFINFKNIKTGFLKKYMLSKLSKKLYKKYGFKITKRILFVLLFVLNLGGEIKKICKSILKRVL
ncbi:MAG: Coenzyme F420 hydrogenase/dehydrogenase, beta subunit C-terminal domain [archaeon]